MTSIPETTNGQWHPPTGFRQDIRKLKQLMKEMLKGFSFGERGVYRPRIDPVITLHAKDVLKDQAAINCAMLLAFPWFREEEIPPVVKVRRDDVVPELLNPNTDTEMERLGQPYVPPAPAAISHPASVGEEHRRFHLLPTLGEGVEPRSSQVWGLRPDSATGSSGVKSSSSSSSSSSDDESPNATFGFRHLSISEKSFGLRNMRKAGRVTGAPRPGTSPAASSSQGQILPGKPGPSIILNLTKPKESGGETASKPSGSRAATKPSPTGEKRKERDSDNIPFVYVSQKGAWSGQPGAPAAVADAQVAGSSGIRGRIPASVFLSPRFRRHELPKS